MESRVSEILKTHGKWYTLSPDELQSWTESFKPHSEESDFEIKQMEYVLVQLWVHNWSNLPIDYHLIEDIYQRLLLPPSDIPSIPFHLKIHLTKELFSLFKKIDHKSREAKMVKIIKELVQDHPEDKELGKVYVYCLSWHSKELVTLEQPDYSKYMQDLQDIVNHYNFEDQGRLE